MVICQGAPCTIVQPPLAWSRVACGYRLCCTQLCSDFLKRLLGCAGQRTTLGCRQEGSMHADQPGGSHLTQSLQGAATCLVAQRSCLPNMAQHSCVLQLYGCLVPLCPACHSPSPSSMWHVSCASWSHPARLSWLTHARGASSDREKHRPARREQHNSN